MQAILEIGELRRLADYFRSSRLTCTIANSGKLCTSNC